MNKIIFSIAMIVFVVILGMCNIEEDFVLPQVNYEWGLHGDNDRLKMEPEQIDVEVESKKKDYSWHMWNEKKPEYDKISRGEYKCYYEPGDDGECKKAMAECSIKSHPDFNKYMLKSKIPSQPDLSRYILKSQIPGAPDMTNYVHSDKLPDMTQFINKDELNKYTRNDQIPPPTQCPKIPECPTCPKCPEQVIQKTKYNFNEHPDFDKYMLKADCNKTTFGELIPSFLKKEASNLSDKIQERRNRYDMKC
jgi:hypothetical protein